VQEQTRKFDQAVAGLKDKVAVYTVSLDMPFARSAFVPKQISRISKHFRMSAITRSDRTTACERRATDPAGVRSIFVLDKAASLPMSNTSPKLPSTRTTTKPSPLLKRGRLAISGLNSGKEETEDLAVLRFLYFLRSALFKSMKRHSLSVSFTSGKLLGNAIPVVFSEPVSLYQQHYRNLIKSLPVNSCVRAVVELSEKDRWSAATE